MTKAYLDSFNGLIPCKVKRLINPHNQPMETSANTSVDCEIEITKTIGAYRKGETLIRSSIHVIPSKNIKRGKYKIRIGHYTIGELI